MATWHNMGCSASHEWATFSRDDTEPTAEQRLCPEDGQPAAWVHPVSIDHAVRITIAASAGAPPTQGDTRARFFLEASTWGGDHLVTSARRYSWEDAVKLAGELHNLPWDEVERRWRRSRW